MGIEDGNGKAMMAIAIKGSVGKPAWTNLALSTR